MSKKQKKTKKKQNGFVRFVQERVRGCTILVTYYGLCHTFQAPTFATIATWVNNLFLGIVADVIDSREQLTWSGNFCWCDQLLRIVADVIAIGSLIGGHFKFLGSSVTLSDLGAFSRTFHWRPSWLNSPRSLLETCFNQQKTRDPTIECLPRDPTNFYFWRDRYPEIFADVVDSRNSWRDRFLGIVAVVIDSRKWLLTWSNPGNSWRDRFLGTAGVIGSHIGDHLEFLGATWPRHSLVPSRPRRVLTWRQP